MRMNRQLILVLSFIDLLQTPSSRKAAKPKQAAKWNALSPGVDITSRVDAWVLGTADDFESKSNQQ